MPGKKTIAALALGTAGVLVATGAALASTGTAAQAASTHAAAGQVKVPPSLQVPAGNRLEVSLHVLQGVQVYECESSAWVNIEPDADMAVVGSQRPTVLYTAGPRWVSTVDGSAVTGAPAVKYDVPGTIPWLLVKAVSNRGDGLFGKVDWIQRLDTWGGLPPQGSCMNGSFTASPYSALERFWVPDNS
jgi:hypothetical protein